ncbi:hypothetical protein HDU92_005784 [Lobulomyces angularis]|nr:hypothetical protein HDU92_005784 [Lobulomyces angularis]
MHRESDTPLKQKYQTDQDHQIYHQLNPQQKFNQQQTQNMNGPSNAIHNSNLFSNPQHVSNNQEQICQHLYSNVYVHGLYSDMFVKFQPIPSNLPNQPLQLKDFCGFKLHKILALRSPVFAQLLQDYQQDGSCPEFVIPTSDPNLTPEGLNLVIGHLYSNLSQNILLNPPQQYSQSQWSNLLRSVLGASSLLSLFDLGNLAKDLIKQDFKKETLANYCKFFTHPIFEINYSLYAKELKEEFFIYLAKGLVREVVELHGQQVWLNRQGEAYRTLVNLFVELPFEWMKKVIESKEFETSSEMERYHFANEVIQSRSRQQLTPQSEEAVLMAFGSKNGITIVRKASKKNISVTNGGATEYNGTINNNVNGVNRNTVGSVGERKVWKVQGL